MKRCARVVFALCCALAVFSGSGCHTPNEGEQGRPPTKPIVKTADLGAVKLTVEVDKDTITIAERLELTIGVEADVGIDVKMPQFGASLSAFQIRDFREMPLEQLDDGRRRWTQIYDLDIYLSGEYSVPAITAQYRDRRDAQSDEEPGTSDASERVFEKRSQEPSRDREGAIRAQGQESLPHGRGSEKASHTRSETPMAELSTEPFAITVTSLLEGDFDPTDFRDVKDVVDLPRDRSLAWALWIAVPAAACVLLIVLVALLWRRARRRSERLIAIPPHEWALDQLRQLVESKLIEAGQVQQFYYRLNEIVRTYIELRFGLMAPERTTEEFLAELSASNTLPASFGPLLSDFLQACDMVKYARYQPATEEIERVFNRARDFVDQAEPVQEPAQEVAA